VELATLLRRKQPLRAMISNIRDWIAENSYTKDKVEARFTGYPKRALEINNVELLTGNISVERFACAGNL